jgi:uncharacterized protein YwgA
MIAEKIPERGWIPLYALQMLRKIPTATKMQKLVFLIQTEGKIDGYRFFKNHYGPFSNELEVDVKSFSQPHGLMQTRIIEGARYPYYVYQPTSKGQQLVGQYIEENIPKKIRKRAENLIKKYGSKNYKQLLEYVYKKYVIPRETFDKTYSHLTDDLNSLNSLWTNWYRDDCPASFLILAVVEYSSKALSKVKATNEPVLQGVCASSISELTGKIMDLTAHWRSPEECSVSFKSLFSEISDQITFIDHFCGRQGIISNIAEIDFSDFINEEELKRLEDVLAKVRPSELMY